MTDLQFDAHQFEGHNHPVNAEYTQNGWTSNGVAFEDYQRMQTKKSSVSRRCQLWTPAFAASTEQLQSVLIRRAQLYLYGGAKIPPQHSWQAINAATTKRALRPHLMNCSAHKRHENEAHIAAVQRAGGYLELQAALAYRAWRLGEDSVAVGESLGMTPYCVRKNLHRLCEVARGLGFETFPRHYSFNRTRPRKGATTAFEMAVLALWNSGERRIGRIVRVLGDTSNSRVKRVLVNAGLYQRRTAESRKAERDARAQARKAERKQAAEARKAELAAARRHKAAERNEGRPCPGKKRRDRRGRRVEYLNAERCIELYLNGMTNITNIAVEMGYPRGVGQNRVRRALIKAGVYENQHLKLIERNSGRQ